ncbi:hypothetical protein B0H11DRAFT_2103462 [Mycena galericulata]|nr:hypothetical protein B0H11DRAFT_2103462 [Mycena galericulata]
MALCSACGTSFSGTPLRPEPSQAALIQDLLRSQAVLGADQHRSLLSSLSEQLARYDDEVARLKDRMNALLVDRSILQRQYNGCHSLLAPIRRLPSEILGEIFAVNSAALWDADIGTSGPRMMDRLVQRPLMNLSQVCARWRAIVMGTPSFWTQIQLDGLLLRTHTTLSRTHPLADQAMKFLQSTLQRGGDLPLTVRVTNDTTSPLDQYRPALELLAQHSKRWRFAEISCSFAELQYFSHAKGKLPLLETLYLNIQEAGAEPISMFEVAPRLRNLFIAGDPLPHVSRPSSEQLQVIGYTNLASTDIATAVSSMSALSQMNTFHLQFFLDDWTEIRSANIQLAITPTASDIRCLLVEVEGEFYRRHCQQALDEIVASLTLPHLEELKFRSKEYPRFPLVWTQTPFLSLSTRSAFHDHLHSLSIADVHITEVQLLQCLITLPSLRQLEISDHIRLRGRGVNFVLITDSLLRALTWTPEPGCLVPRLNVLRMRSRLEFNEDVYLQLVRSRLRPGRTASGNPFTAAIVPHSEGCRPLDPSVHAQLRELRIHKELLFTLSTPV